MREILRKFIKETGLSPLDCLEIVKKLNGIMKKP